MAHFMTLVLVNSDEIDPSAKAEEMMLPYFSDDSDEDSSYNPSQSKCDSFSIGGRYDGDIWGKEQNYNLKPHEFQARYGMDVVKVQDNILPVAMLREGLLPYAIVTPDGAWQDCKGKTKGEWAGEIKSILQVHLKCLAIAIDCHC